MSRSRLPDRRPSVTQRVTHVLSSGDEISMLVTFSFPEEGSRDIREIFCADFKAGSDFHTLVIDASILVSRLLQHGNTPSQLLASLSEPTSIIGSILKAAVAVEENSGS